MTDEQGYLTSFNDKWLSFTGMSTEGECGDGWTFVVHPDDLLNTIHKYNNSFQSHKEFVLKYRLRRYDGVYYWALNHGWPIVDKNNEFLGYIGICDLLDRDESSDDLNGDRIGYENIKQSKPVITKREEEILKLIADGYRNKQIAKILDISINTVRNHISNLFHKYKVSNRVQLCKQINEQYSKYPSIHT